MHTAEDGTKLHDCAMVRSAARSAPIGLYTTSLLGVVQRLLNSFSYSKPHNHKDGILVHELLKTYFSLLPLPKTGGSGGILLHE